jgi:serine/threonine protein kinase
MPLEYHCVLGLLGEHRHGPQICGGWTMYEVVKAHPELTNGQKVDYHNQLLDGLTHLHSYGLHSDISLLNIQVTHLSNNIKLLDFGQSISADSNYYSLEDDPIDPFDFLTHKSSLIETPSTSCLTIHI